MKQTIELKRVGPRHHVQQLLEELIARLDEKLRHFPKDAVSLHVLFEENGSHKLFHTALTCHLPRHTVAAHEEGRDAGAVIRRAFAEVERQLEKQKAVVRSDYLRRAESQRRRRPTPGLLTVWLAAWLLLPSRTLRADEPQAADSPSPKAAEAMHLLNSSDPYDRQLGFLRLEALREPATVPTITPYLDSRDPELRAQSLRALAAIQGPQAVPVLLQRLKSDHHPRVRRAALLGLEPFQTSSPEILPAFIKALRDRHTEVRMAAVDVVSRIDEPQAREAILLRYRRERRRDVRRVLELAIKRVKSS